MLGAIAVRRAVWRRRAIPKAAYTASLSSLAARNATFLLALIWMGSPVAGLRPIRAARVLTSRIPRPFIRILAPVFRCVVMAVTKSASKAWFGIGGFGVTRTRRNGRLLDPDGGWQVIFRGRPGGPRGSRVLGLRRAEAQQFEPMRMAFAGQQFTRTTSGSLRAWAAHETPVVQEEP